VLLRSYMHGFFAVLQFLDQAIDTLNGQCIQALRDESAVALDFGFELFAPLAHGSPLRVGRERAALSVTDRKPEQGGDGRTYSIRPVPDR
jgi:hypothetical protein